MRSTDNTKEPGVPIEMKQTENAEGGRYIEIRRKWEMGVHRILVQIKRKLRLGNPKGKTLGFISVYRREQR